MKTYRIFADLNERITDERGEYVPIANKGSWQFESFPFKSNLAPGNLIFLSDGELQVQAKLEYDENKKYWIGFPEWSTLRELQSCSEGLDIYQDFPAEDKLLLLQYETIVKIRSLSGGLEFLDKVDIMDVDGISKETLYQNSFEQMQRTVDDLENIIATLTGVQTHPAHKKQ